LPPVCPLPASEPTAVPDTDRLSSLTAFFPVRDEEDNVVPMADALLRVLPIVAQRAELIIVDDGSVDRTGQLAEEVARRHALVRVIHHAAGRGYGAALRTRLAAARGEYIFLTDGDRQFDSAQLTELVPRIADADAVVGYRRLRSDPLGRRLNGSAWNVLVRALFGVQIRDVNCAFKLLRRQAISEIPLASEGATLSAELLVGLRRRRRRIIEVPVDHFPRRAGTSSGANVDVILRAFAELLVLL
jgi:glycosyltransferase involved in cell wall biosynthesis